ncbi:hypothetical protein BC834DRAFT_876437 [Gloeopeniophorella convolvens]|nr:hypothetical protein BC834DRAFT_876437 [Gloeopeniophorella convolvens]
MRGRVRVPRDRLALPGPSPNSAALHHPPVPALLACCGALRALHAPAGVLVDARGRAPEHREEARRVLRTDRADVVLRVTLRARALESAPAGGACTRARGLGGCARRCGRAGELEVEGDALRRSYGNRRCRCAQLVYRSAGGLRVLPLDVHGRGRGRVSWRRRRWVKI